MRIRGLSGSYLRVGAALASASLAAGCGAGDGGSSRQPAAAAGVPERGCEIGAERSGPGVPPTERAIVLGCGRTRSGAAIQLYSFPDAAGPCLNIAGLPGGTRACGRAPSERVPPARAAIGGAAIVRRSARAELELYGETMPNVRRVLVRYRLPDGRSGQISATLIRVRDTAALKAAGIRQPFGYFVAAVPQRARQVSAVALGEYAQVLGRLSFDRLARGMHPTVFIAVEQ